MLKVKVVQAAPVPKRLCEIPNATFFTGTIQGYVQQGPFLKVGSSSEFLWCVVKLEAMEGGVWVSSRERDRDAIVTDYKELNVKQIVLRDHEEPLSAAAVDPHASRTGKP